ncbi:hypothetical protein Dsin_005231 [Dipteronia sinensis]|uniref:LOB domain-containing protein n=1 Tax=Dipteronia sinensis TaxID=43782 RepID=A0AAE0EEQ4_9ROSI|nr:hypothetical protein Dsin_005231 [Dipteronia sinensis]
MEFELIEKNLVDEGKTEEPLKFKKVHQTFGTSNVVKLINELDKHLWEEVVNSLVYESKAWMLNLVYGCI